MNVDSSPTLPGDDEVSSDSTLKGSLALPPYQGRGNGGIELTIAENELLLEPLFGNSDEEATDDDTLDENDGAIDPQLFGTGSVWEDAIAPEPEPVEEPSTPLVPVVLVPSGSTADREDKSTLPDLEDDDKLTENPDRTESLPGDGVPDSVVPPPPIEDDRPVFPPFDPDEETDIFSDRFDVIKTPPSRRNLIYTWSLTGAIGLIGGVILGMLLFL